MRKPPGPLPANSSASTLRGTGPGGAETGDAEEPGGAGAVRGQPVRGETGAGVSRGREGRDAPVDPLAAPGGGGRGQGQAPEPAHLLLSRGAGHRAGRGTGAGGATGGAGAAAAPESPP